MSSINSNSPIDDQVLQRIKYGSDVDTEEHVAEQIRADNDLEDAQAMGELGGIPLEIKRSSRTLEERGAKRVKKAKEATAGGTSFKKITEIAKNHAQKNPDELSQDELLKLLSEISESDSNDDILEKALKVGKDDPTSTEEVLGFLQEAASDKLQEKMTQIHQDYNQTFEREILAGRNIAKVTTEYSTRGIGNANNLRKMYRDITGYCDQTGQPYKANELFKQLFKQYPFEKLETTIKFLLASIGADLTSPVPSIKPPKRANPSERSIGT